MKIVQNAGRTLHIFADVEGHPSAPQRSGSVDRGIECVPMNASFSSKLSGMTLPDVDGKPVKLGSLWANQSAVVVFLRHYG